MLNKIAITFTVIYSLIFIILVIKNERSKNSAWNTIWKGRLKK